VALQGTMGQCSQYNHDRPERSERERETEREGEVRDNSSALLRQYQADLPQAGLILSRLTQGRSAGVSDERADLNMHRHVAQCYDSRQEGRVCFFVQLVSLPAQGDDEDQFSFSGKHVHCRLWRSLHPEAWIPPQAPLTHGCTDVRMCGCRNDRWRHRVDVRAMVSGGFIPLFPN